MHWCLPAQRLYDMLVRVFYLLSLNVKIVKNRLQSLANCGKVTPH